MYIVHQQWRRLTIAALVCLICPHVVRAADETPLTKEQIKQFLLTAEVVHSQQAKKGITHTSRLTLSDGTITHDASFQPIDEHKARMELASGTELNFVDSYKYNIAAYALAELLGMDDMLPVYVERKWEGNVGSLSWWLPVKMDEVERHKQKLTAPDADAWNNQMYKIRVFDQLVSDTDANLTNVLIGEMCIRDRKQIGRAGNDDRRPERYPARGIKAVSYTHLDVYKRQLRHRGAGQTPRRSRWPRCRWSNPDRGWQSLPGRSRFG